MVGDVLGWPDGGRKVNCLMTLLDSGLLWRWLSVWLSDLVGDGSPARGSSPFSFSSSLSCSFSSSIFFKVRSPSFSHHNGVFI